MLKVRRVGWMTTNSACSGGSTIGPDIVDVGDGWGGDHYVAWREGDDRTCIRTAFVMDTPEDLDVLSEALTEWAADQEDARVQAGPDRVVFTSCD